MRHYKIGLLAALVLVLGYAAAWGVAAVPGNTTAYTVVTTSTQVLGAKAGNVRHGFLIQNIGVLPVFAKICAPNAASCTATAATGIYIPAPAATVSSAAGQLQMGPVGNAQWGNIEVPQGEIDVIATGTTTIIVMEW